MAVRARLLTTLARLAGHFNVVRRADADSRHGEIALLSDGEWFARNVAAATIDESREADSADGLVPLLPAAADQIRFTGRAGKENLEQAFEFYKFCRDAIAQSGSISSHDKILDFGCGWGRIARFWLRDVRPTSLWCVDCLTDAIVLLKQTRIRAHVVQNAALPPIAGEIGKFRLIYAFSVFSHLSEQTAHAWIEYFAGLLAQDGMLIVTTRGRNYLDTLEHLRAVPPQDFHQQDLIRRAPPQAEIERRYAAGEFVFFGTGGGGELHEDFYGEAIIPPRYASKFEQFGLRLESFREDVPLIDQAVIVLRKLG